VPAPAALSRHQRVIRSGIAAGVAGLIAVVVAFAVGVFPVPGADTRGIGDPYFPSYGNSGYDVDHYRIDVAYDPATEDLRGTTTVTAIATADLTEFTLDFVLKTTSVTVDGTPAAFRQSRLALLSPGGGGELIVTPVSTINAGAAMTIVIGYSDAPFAASVNGTNPWISTPTGAVVQGEPAAAAWWFPSNDHPRDKATYSILVTVPAELEGLSNGILLGSERTGATTTWSWRVDEPMASYLAFLAVGDYSITELTLDSGVPYLSAIEVGSSAALSRAAEDIARTPEVIEWIEGKFGPYPFTAAGGVVVDVDYGECCALENQTRPTYPTTYWKADSQVGIVVHEAAHQWFGNSISVANWSDIWLNEGPAVYTEWLWNAEHGGLSAQTQFEEAYARPASSPFWKLRIADPGAANIFHDAVYVRGAMTLHALSNRVGEEMFFDIMKTWLSEREYGNGTVAEFSALASDVSGEDLAEFFQTWTDSPRKPEATATNGVKP